MIEVKRENYTLLMSHNPCEIFSYYGESDLHGLNYYECAMHDNTNHSAYIAGFSNYVPKHDDSDKNEYKHGDDFFVFINLSRCITELDTITLIFHEMMHRAFELYNWDVDKEEDMISWANDETIAVYGIVKQNINI